MHQGVHLTVLVGQAPAQRPDGVGLGHAGQVDEHPAGPGRLHGGAGLLGPGAVAPDDMDRRPQASHFGGRGEASPRGGPGHDHRSPGHGRELTPALQARCAGRARPG